MRTPRFRDALLACAIALAIPGCGRRVDERTRQGYDLVVAGKIDEAIALANSILADNANHVGALNVLGLALYKSGDIQGSMVPLQKAIEIDPRFPEAHFNLGNAYNALKRTKEAEAEFAAAVEAQDKFVLARYNLGKIYEGSGRVDQALAQYRRVVDLDPQFVYAHMDLGKILEESGDFPGAIASYERALELQPTIKELRVRLGNSYFKSQEADAMRRAEEQYRTAVGIDSTYVDALYSLAVVLTSESRGDEAVPWFRRALLASGPDADTQVTRQIRQYFKQSAIPEEGSIEPLPPAAPKPAPPDSAAPGATTS